MRAVARVIVSMPKSVIWKVSCDRPREASRPQNHKLQWNTSMFQASKNPIQHEKWPISTNVYRLYAVATTFIIIVFVQLSSQERNSTFSFKFCQNVYTVSHALHQATMSVLLINLLHNNLTNFEAILWFLKHNHVKLFFVTCLPVEIH